LVNDRIDTMGLTSRLLPSLRRPSLETVAKHFGVNRRKGQVHRAGVDAEMTGHVALRLAVHAKGAGYSSLDQLKGLSGGLPRRPSERHSGARRVLDARMLESIPMRPGVYIMTDINGDVTYVGKAKNLRERVGTYFSQRIGQTRKMDNLIESLAKIDTVVVGSELEALLLESQLIRRHDPRYNRQLRGHESYPFIKVDLANAWPRIMLAHARKDDGARYYGPFRRPSMAKTTVDSLNRVFSLRTCTRSFRTASSFGRPCMELDLGRCPGPCVGKADRDAYLTNARAAVEFLDGRDDAAYETLWAGLEDAALRLDFERANTLRRELKTVASIVASQRRLREVVEAATCLVVLPSVESGAREMLLVGSGKVWAQLRADGGEPDESVAARLARSWGRMRERPVWPIDHDTVDDAFIIRRWLALAAGMESVIPIGEAPDWHELAARALAIPLDALPADFAALGGSADVELDEEADADADVMPGFLSAGEDAGDPSVYSPGETDAD
ncbi:MAG: GIY-YIG nuclease family protein, partial [Thermomicrobiales bacterium]